MCDFSVDYDIPQLIWGLTTRPRQSVADIDYWDIGKTEDQDSSKPTLPSMGLAWVWWMEDIFLKTNMVSFFGSIYVSNRLRMGVEREKGVSEDWICPQSLRAILVLQETAQRLQEWKKSIDRLIFLKNQSSIDSWFLEEKSISKNPKDSKCSIDFWEKNLDFLIDFRLIFTKIRLIFKLYYIVKQQYMLNVWKYVHIYKYIHMLLHTLSPMYIYI